VQVFRSLENASAMMWKTNRKVGEEEGRGEEKAAKGAEKPAFRRIVRAAAQCAPFLL
jgi:hypothetical protein